MVKAKLTLNNERKSPIKSGYRPLFLIDGGYYSGAVFFDKDINPGETEFVYIDFADFDGYLLNNKLIEIFESSIHKVGEVLIAD